MPKIRFDMEEIRLVMEKHAQSMFKLTGNENNYFDAEVSEDSETENVVFIIDCDEKVEQGH
jgi:hypothetical protein